MEHMPGFVDSNSSLFCNLHKALYGLKYSPRQWFESLQISLLNLQFKLSRCDPSLFILTLAIRTISIRVYVDDIIITGSRPSLSKDIIAKLNSSFSLKHLGDLVYFLGIEVKVAAHGSLTLTQSKYLRDLLHKTHMSESSPVHSPMQSTCKLTKTGSPALEDHFMYRSVVGTLRYATITRPDVAYAINKVCQFTSHPLETHWVAVKGILRYLKGTIHHGLHLPSHSPTQFPSLRVFCDTD